MYFFFGGWGYFSLGRQSPLQGLGPITQVCIRMKGAFVHLAHTCVVSEMKSAFWLSFCQVMGILETFVVPARKVHGELISIKDTEIGTQQLNRHSR